MGITYATFARTVRACANTLPADPLVAGRAIAFDAPASLETIIEMFAVVRSGGAALLVNPALPDAARNEALEKAGQATLLPADYPGGIQHMLTELDPSSSNSPAIECELKPFDCNRPATIVMTSGSTGTPKFVVHSFANHHASALAANRNISVQPDDRWLLSLPLYHVAGIGVVVRCIAAGASVAIPEPEDTIAGAINRYGVTHVSLVATQLYRLMQQDAGRAALSSLKAVLLGGGAIPESLVRDAHRLGVPIHTSYGMTETASQIACTPPGASLEQLLTSGRPLTDDTIAIANDSEILVRGDSLFLGYAQEDGALDRPLTNAGWFRTGDLGEFNANGYLRVLGRKDNQFISGGENIQPEEIERALMTVDNVAEAVVVPVHDAEWGHRPVAFIRTPDGSAPDAAALQAALAPLLPAYKRPKDFRPLPHAPEGALKPSRAQLAQYAAGQRGQTSINVR